MIDANDGSVNEDIETVKAEELLSWRPGIYLQTLPSKGGPKFFGYTGASFELRKIDEQLKQYNNVLRSKKVRKASKLGKAEWMSQCGLAKVTKQGKFIQTMGHHNGEFFALYPEEALFLLDIGDIELTINDVPVSLQEAFSVILHTKSCHFTLDEYNTFSHLVKRGFIVQRYGVSSKRAKSKRQRSSPEKPNTSQAKYPKLDGQIKSSESKHTNDCASSESYQGCREWYIRSTKHETSTKPFTPLQSSPVTKLAFPNLAKRSDNHLPAPSECLLPAGIPSRSYIIDEIWFERIKRDDGKRHVKQQRGTHNRNRLLRYEKCRNWSEYEEFKLRRQTAENAELQKLHNRVDTWEVKPLILPGTSSVRDSLNRVRTIAERSESTQSKSQNSVFNLRYNVYEAASTPFKKTNPGRANFVVVVTNARTTPPTSLDILSLSKNSKGVPIRFAVVDDGQVSFYEFEMTNISVV